MGGIENDEVTGAPKSRVNLTKRRIPGVDQGEWIELQHEVHHAVKGDQKMIQGTIDVIQ
jgi:hypothetical protein